MRLNCIFLLTISYSDPIVKTSKRTTQFRNRVSIDKGLFIMTKSANRAPRAKNVAASAQNDAAQNDVATQQNDANVAVKRKRKAPQIVQNGVPMPREGTVGKKLWDLCDEIAAKCEGGYKQIRLAVIQAAGDDYNPGNVRTELSVWRRFNGIPKTNAPRPHA